MNQITNQEIRANVQRLIELTHERVGLSWALPTKQVQYHFKEIYKVAKPFFKLNPTITDEDLKFIIMADVDEVKETFGRLLGFSKLFEALANYDGFVNETGAEIPEDDRYSDDLTDML